MQWLFRRSVIKHLAFDLFFLAIAFDPASALDGSTIAPYGLDCKAALGALPDTFNCHDGEVLDVGAIDKTTTPNTCAHPPWLKLGNNEQCVDGSRLLKLLTIKPNTEVRVICRRYVKKTDPINDKMYEDIAIVAHNTDTGATCFFQALNDNGMDGTKIPSPMADPNALLKKERNIAKRAATFWMKPEDLNANALRCTQCHDNNAWMHTPYSDQNDQKAKATKVPTDYPLSSSDTWSNDAIDVPNQYYLVDQDFFVAHNWPKPNSILTAKIKVDDTNTAEQECTSCHRMGDRRTKESEATPRKGGWVDWSTENPTHIPQERSDLNWKQYRFMPEDSGAADDADWVKRYAKHVKAMKCCLDDPTKLGCASMPIFGIKKGDKPTWGTKDKGVCINDSGEVAFHLTIDPQVVAARDAADTSCSAPLNQEAVSTFQITHLPVTGPATTSLAIIPVTSPVTSSAPPKLGYKVPVDPSYNPNASLFPGDTIQITLQNLTAWDSGHHLLQFDRWSDASSGGPGTPNQCPCEDPTDPTCKFSTLGASDWFGTNPNSPTYPGDPPTFQCVAQFKSTGDCTTPPPTPTSTPAPVSTITGQGYFSNAGSNMTWNVSFTGPMSMIYILFPTKYSISACGSAMYSPNANFDCYCGGRLFPGYSGGANDVMSCYYTGPSWALPANTPVSISIDVTPTLAPGAGVQLFGQPPGAPRVGPITMTGP